MTRQAIETRTRLLIARDILERLVILGPVETRPLSEEHTTRVMDALHAISRAANSLEPLPNA